MTAAESLSTILNTSIAAAELVAVNGNTLVFRCEPQQEIRLRITSRLLEIRGDRRPVALFAARFLFEHEAKFLLTLAEASRNEVNYVRE